MKRHSSKGRKSTSDMNLLLEDFRFSSNFIDKMDAQLFEIRKMATVSASAVIAFAISQNRSDILWANVLVIISFLLMDLAYKSFHEDGLKKSWILEELIMDTPESKELEEHYFFGIGHLIEPVSLGKMLRIGINKNRAHIRLLYLLLIFFTGLAYFYIKNK